MFKAVQNAEVTERVRRVLEQHTESERMLDAYWQWATNPTPPSAGYALEENCGFIATNLLVRYGQPAIDLVTRLADECRDLRDEASVYEIRQAIIQVLNTHTGDLLRDGVAKRLSEATPARRLLAAWAVNRARWHFPQGREIWLAGEFDWSLGIELESSKTDLKTELASLLAGPQAQEADLLREGLAVGLVNRLFYRNAAGRMEPKMRPGPRLPLSAVTY